jgi:hypothetical protein
MAGRRTVFNLEVLGMLEQHVREGAFEWVAAEAAGISRRTFYYWLKRGERGEEPWVVVAVRVRQAQAQARLGAEKRVRLESPLSWLRLGPGRERAGKPGWTLPVHQHAEETAEAEEPSEEDVAMVKAVADALREAEG